MLSKYSRYRDSELEKIQNETFEHLITIMVQIAKSYFLANPNNLERHPNVISHIDNSYCMRSYKFRHEYEIIATYYLSKYANIRYLPLKELNMPISTQDWEDHWCKFFVNEIGILIDREPLMYFSILYEYCVPNSYKDNANYFAGSVQSYYMPALDRVL